MHNSRFIFEQIWGYSLVVPRHANSSDAMRQSAEEIRYIRFVFKEVLSALPIEEYLLLSKLIYFTLEMQRIIESCKCCRGNPYYENNNNRIARRNEGNIDELMRWTEELHRSDLHPHRVTLFNLPKFLNVEGSNREFCIVLLSSLLVVFWTISLFLG